MALTESNVFEVGRQAPDFKLLNTIDDKLYSLNQLKGKKGTAIFFICNHCPFVIHIHQELVNMAKHYLEKDINFIAISSNDKDLYPEDGPEEMKKNAHHLHYPFPYLFDESQEVARAYHAACTPDFYLFDAELKSVYHGQLDDSRPGNGILVTGKDFRNAMDLLLINKPNPNTPKPSIGCSIKWRNG